MIQYYDKKLNAQRLYFSGKLGFASVELGEAHPELRQEFSLWLKKRQEICA